VLLLNKLLFNAVDGLTKCHWHSRLHANCN